MRTRQATIQLNQLPIHGPLGLQRAGAWGVSNVYVCMYVSAYTFLSLAALEIIFPSENESSIRYFSVDFYFKNLY